MKTSYRYVDAKKVTAQLDDLIKKPIHGIGKEALASYEKNYYGEKCKGSRAMVDEAVSVIPGGVQHNLAFNHPFPLVFTKAEGNRLYDVDGNEYFDFLQAGGPTVLGSNPPYVREKVEELLDTCGPSTGLFHEYEYKMAEKMAELVPSVDMVRMFGSGTEACMGSIRIAR
ncbi:MAG TPA: aminotransferase class III-fold pyridoxal phosphate-dependent enzyme, partial [Clostridiaceae bacterium]|nr:aminotransferase class III-fold pyridoxal phosphate-dependent enzyme [Clostridiaceae bacterium]